MLGIRHRRAKLAAVVASLLVASTLFSPVARAESDESPNKSPIKIGFIAEQSGAAATIGNEMVKGFQLYLKQTGSKMAGHPVHLLVENSESSQYTAVAVAHKLVEKDKVDVLSGLILGNLGYVVAPVAEKAQVPLVISICGSDDLTQRKRSPWVLRTSFSASQPMYPFGEYVYKTLGYKRVVIMGLDYSYGWEVCGGFQKSFERAGGQVVQKIWAPLGFMDFGAQLAQIRKDADAVFICTAGSAAAILPKQYKEMGLKLPLIGTGTSFDEAIVRKLGDTATGAVTALPYSAAINTPNNQRFVAAFRAEYGTAPDFYAEGGYTSAMWIARAVEALNGDVRDKKKFLAALSAVQLKDAPRGPVRLDAYGNPVENIYVRKVEKVGPEAQNVVMDTFKDASQFGDESPEEYLKQPPFGKDYPPCTHCSSH